MPQPPRPRRVPCLPWSLPLAVLALTACVQPTTEASGGEAAAPPARLRRLTRAEYDATASALLGVPVQAAQAWAPGDTLLGYGAHEGLQVDALLADQVQSSAEALAEVGVQRLGSLAPCAAGEEAAACARRFVSGFAPRAFRRPVEEAEVTGLLALFEAGSRDADYAAGIRQVLQGVFAAPSFLYRSELGPAGAAPGSVVELTPHEVASALSYSLAGGPPDEALREAADAGALRTPEQREAHARRLLLHGPQGRAQLRRFVDEWMGLTGLSHLNKNNQVYPEYDTGLLASMAAEKDAFVEHVLFSSGAALGELLAAPYTFVDDRLATLYGLPERPGEALARVPLPPERAGLLTQAALLATYAHLDSSSPVKRGKFLHTRLLCRTISPPPPELMVATPPVDPNATTRQRFARHAQDPACGTCHRQLDPLGFAMEDFDGLGKHRTQENGQPVDASGSIPTASGEPGVPLTGGAQLARALAQSAEVADCVSVQALRFALGRVERTSDAALLASMRAAMRQSGGSVLEPFVRLAASPAFVQRRVPNTEELQP